MTTNSEVISDALKEVNVLAETQSLSPEQGQYGLRKLNELMEAWTEDGIELGYFAQSLTTDDCPIPAYAVRAVKASLAAELAPHYGATVSRELGAKISDAYSSLLRKVVVENAPTADMSHMPMGSALGGTYDITR